MPGESFLQVLPVIHTDVTQTHVILLQVGLNVTANLAGVAFAITAIVLYTISIANPYFWRHCDINSWYYGRTTVSPDPRVNYMKEGCQLYQSQVLVRGKQEAVDY